MLTFSASVARLPYPKGLRPVALRPRLSAGLPFTCEANVLRRVQTTDLWNVMLALLF